MVLKRDTPRPLVRSSYSVHEVRWLKKFRRRHPLVSKVTLDVIISQNRRESGMGYPHRRELPGQ